MASPARRRVGAVVAVVTVVGTVLALHFGTGSGLFGSSDSDVTNQGAPGIDGSYMPVPSASGGTNSVPPGGGSNPEADAGGGFGGGGSAGGSGGAGTGDRELGWDTTIRQPRSPDQVDGNVNPGVLAVSTPDAGLNRLVVDRNDGVARGSLTPMLVQDFRGSLDGWTLTGAMSDFRAEDGSRVEARHLVWEPHCGPHPGRGPYPSEPKAGPRVQSSPTATLCSTSSSTSVTGGEFDVGADLTLRLPDRNTSAESFSATLTLTLS